MAQCKWCEKRGIFLSVNTDGLCKSCAFIVISDAKSKIRVINDSGEIILKSNNTDTIVSRSEIAINHLQDLIKYEEKGIPILKQSVKEMIIEFANTSNERLTDLLKVSFQATKEKFTHTKSGKTRATTCNKFIEKANKLKALLNKNGNNFVECESLIENYIFELKEKEGTQEKLDL